MPFPALSRTKQNRPRNNAGNNKMQISGGLQGRMGRAPAAVFEKSETSGPFVRPVK